MQQKQAEILFVKLVFKDNVSINFDKVIILISTITKILRIQPRKIKNKVANFYGQKITIPLSHKFIDIIISKVNDKYNEQIGRIHLNSQDISNIHRKKQYISQNQQMKLIWKGKIINPNQQSKQSSISQTQRVNDLQHEFDYVLRRRNTSSSVVVSNSHKITDSDLGLTTSEKKHSKYHTNINSNCEVIVKPLIVKTQRIKIKVKKNKNVTLQKITPFVKYTEKKKGMQKIFLLNLFIGVLIGISIGIFSILIDLLIIQ